MRTGPATRVGETYHAVPGLRNRAGALATRGAAVTSALGIQIACQTQPRISDQAQEQHRLIAQVVDAAGFSSEPQEPLGVVAEEACQEGRLDLQLLEPRDHLLGVAVGEVAPVQNLAGDLTLDVLVDAFLGREVDIAEV